MVLALLVGWLNFSYNAHYWPYRVPATTSAPLGSTGGVVVDPIQWKDILFVGTLLAVGILYFLGRRQPKPEQPDRALQDDRDHWMRAAIDRETRLNACTEELAKKKARSEDKPRLIPEYKPQKISDLSTRTADWVDFVLSNNGAAAFSIKMDSSIQGPFSIRWAPPTNLKAGGEAPIPFDVLYEGNVVWTDRDKGSPGKIKLLFKSIRESFPDLTEGQAVPVVLSCMNHDGVPALANFKISYDPRSEAITCTLDTTPHG